MFSPFILLPILTLIISIQANTFEYVFFPSPGLHNAYAGSIIAASAGLTTYAVACVPDIGVCPATPTTVNPPGISFKSDTITAGLATFMHTTSTSTAGTSMSQQTNCVLTGTRTATCSETSKISSSGSVVTKQRTQTFVETSTFHWARLTVTAGQENLATSTSSGNAAVVTGVGIVGAVVAVMRIAAGVLL